MVKKMKKIIAKNNGGFTLIEIIVSIVIIGLMSLTFFGLFGFGMKTVIVSGQNSASDFNAQTILEDGVFDRGSDSPEQLEVTDGAIRLYQSGTLVDTIPGEVIKVSYPYNGVTKTAVTFVSD